MRLLTLGVLLIAACGGTTRLNGASATFAVQKGGSGGFSVGIEATGSNLGKYELNAYSDEPTLTFEIDPSVVDTSLPGNSATNVQIRVTAAANAPTTRTTVSVRATLLGEHVPAAAITQTVEILP